MTTQIQTKQSDCGCQPSPCCPPETCCSLDCIERPRFFCGQLLTDHDLQALVHWNRDKYALQRYRDGWGVACGLRLSCKPDEPTLLRIAPGYAVDCCGNDIVICEEICFDLVDLCRDQEDPCSKWRSGKEEEEKEKQGVRFADILLHYAEHETAAQTAIGRNNCYEAVDCEPSRVQETFQLSIEEIPVNTLPDRARFKRWLEGYRACSQIYEEYREIFDNPRGLTGKQIEQFKDWLLAKLRKFPLQRFCFIEREICRIAEGAKQEPNFVMNELHVRQLFFWIELDCRIAYVSRDCHACGESEGVVLGRVVMEDSEEGCCLLSVFDQPPYRRLLAPESLPAGQGCHNLGDLVGVTQEIACQKLREMGIPHSFEKVDLKKGQGGDQIRTLFKFQDHLEACCDDGVRVYLVPNPFGEFNSWIVCDFGPNKKLPPLEEEKPEKPVVEKPTNLPTSSHDLQWLDGIGPARHETLLSAGIKTFRELATVGPADLATIIGVSEDLVAKWQETAKEMVNLGFNE